MDHSTLTCILHEGQIEYSKIPQKQFIAQKNWNITKNMLHH